MLHWLSTEDTVSIFCLLGGPEIAGIWPCWLLNNWFPAHSWAQHYEDGVFVVRLESLGFYIQCYKSEEITVGLDCKNGWAERKQTYFLSRPLSPLSPLSIYSLLSISLFTSPILSLSLFLSLVSIFYLYECMKIQSPFLVYHICDFGYSNTEIVPWTTATIIYADVIFLILLINGIWK